VARVSCTCLIGCRRMHDIVKIAVLVLPLGLDTFALSTALGVGGISARERLRTSVVFTVFEGLMPVVGFVIGAGLGARIGMASSYIAAAVLAAVALYMLWPGRDEEKESQRVALLSRAHGTGLLILGFSISLDELAIGFGIGLLRLSLPLLVSLIAVQAFCAAQIGMRLGSRLRNETGEWAEKLAGVLLLVAAVIVVAS
jgi:putative Mn2+ efflux pump MntP